jgi:hypothetical protein
MEEKSFKRYKEFIAENYISSHPYFKNSDELFGISTKNKSDEYLAIQFYQNGYSVGQIQTFLRTGDSDKKEIEFVKKSISLMDSVFRNIKFEKETELFRGVDNKEYYVKSLIDKGYTSTSKNLNSTVREWSLGGKVIRILAPKGLNYIDMNLYLKRSDIDGFQQEEILLPRNLKYVRNENYKDYETYNVKKA